MSLELRLMLACATWERSTTRHDLVSDAASASGLDWGHWLDLVRYHRLLPHANRQVVALATAPPPIVERLAAGAREVAARALALTSQLADLVRTLDAAGVLAMPFKGPSLALAAYGELGARDCRDLDVVVAERDIYRARGALVGAGYVARHGTSPAQERAVLRSFGHFEFARVGAPAHVELHWRFASPRYPWSLPVAEVLARSRRRALGGVTFAVAEPHDAVLLQCMHGARHQWQQLEWLVALREQIRREQLDATTLLERAGRHGSRRALLLGMGLLRDVLGADLDAHLLRAIAADATLGPLAGKVREGLHRTAAGDSLAEPDLLNARLMERPGNRVRYLLHSIFAPTIREWEVVRLPDALLPLYYPLRLARVVFARTTALRREGS